MASGLGFWGLGGGGGVPAAQGLRCSAWGFGCEFLGLRACGLGFARLSAHKALALRN